MIRFVFHRVLAVSSYNFACLRHREAHGFTKVFYCWVVFHLTAPYWRKLMTQGNLMSIACRGACNDNDRYIVEQEPTCTWAVFDTIDDIPATVDGAVAFGLSLSEATLIAARANNPRAALTLVYGDSEIGVTRPAKPRKPDSQDGSHSDRPPA